MKKEKGRLEMKERRDDDEPAPKSLLVAERNCSIAAPPVVRAPRSGAAALSLTGMCPSITVSAAAPELTGSCHREKRRDTGEK